MTLKEKTIQNALSAVGTMEDPPGSNDGKYVSIYWKFIGYKTPVFWCAAFVSFKIHQAAKDLGITSTWPKDINAGSCTYMVNYLKERGWLLFQPTNNCVFFVKSSKEPGKYIHTGFVVSVNKDGSLITVEGNSSNDGSENGIGVFKRVRQNHNLVFAQII